MARRKRCPRSSLSGSPAEHRVAWERARHELLGQVQDANLAMSAGNCLNAGQAIDEAYVAYGQMLAHNESPEEMSETARLHRAIKEADSPFEAKCVRSEPVEETQKRMAWARPGLAGGGSGPLGVALPSWSFLAPNRDPPHRHHVLARNVVPNEHGVPITYEVAANWPKTRWWLSASFTGHGTRAANGLTTTKREVAEAWARDVQVGDVRVLRREISP